MLSKYFRRLMKDDRFKKKLLEKLNLRKKIRKIPEDPDALNAQALGISGLIAGILKRARGKHTL
jgi:hypothetical protein